MILREFIYFNEKNKDMMPDDRYISDNDKSIYNINDTRKSRLTLKMLRELRLAGEAREKEYKEEMSLVRKMYAVPPPQPI
jgi:hypothetical protein